MERHSIDTEYRLRIFRSERDWIIRANNVVKRRSVAEREWEDTSDCSRSLHFAPSLLLTNWRKRTEGDGPLAGQSLHVESTWTVSIESTRLTRWLIIYRMISEESWSTARIDSSVDRTRAHWKQGSKTREYGGECAIVQVETTSESNAIYTENGGKIQNSHILLARLAFRLKSLCGDYAKLAEREVQGREDLFIFKTLSQRRQK